MMNLDLEEETEFSRRLFSVSPRNRSNYILIEKVVPLLFLSEN